jgi:hypothetical protein
VFFEQRRLRAGVPAVPARTKAGDVGVVCRALLRRGGGVVLAGLRGDAAAAAVLRVFVELVAVVITDTLSASPAIAFAFGRLYVIPAKKKRASGVGPPVRATRRA